MNILSQLGTLKLFGKKVSVISNSGVVVNQKEWVEQKTYTRFVGGIPVGSHTTSTSKSEIHLLDHAGKEFSRRLTEVHGIRVGHVITFFALETSEHLWGLYNHSLDSWQFWWPNVADDLSPSDKTIGFIVFPLIGFGVYESWSTLGWGIGGSFFVGVIIFAVFGSLFGYIANFMGWIRMKIFKSRYQKTITQLIGQHSDSIEHDLQELAASPN